ncbi:outer membrane lipoprotein-sorting protein [Paraburkholderia strydomiana]|nr:outer membrane lipoprotein-sorting protein [Paraburkholderia strydomiana]
MNYSIGGFPWNKGFLKSANGADDPLRHRSTSFPEGSIMKSLIKTVALVVVLAAPVVSFAQSEQPLTRAEVKAQLKQIEQAGYNPAVAVDATYPADIQAAEARIAAQNAMAQSDTTGYGSTATGSSQAGAAAPAK